MDVYVVTTEQYFANHFSVDGAASTLEAAITIAGGGEWKTFDGDEWVPTDWRDSNSRIYRFQLAAANTHETTVRKGPSGRYVWSCTCGREAEPNGYTRAVTAFERSLDHFASVPVH